jgi:hypothetical protein
VNGIDAAGISCLTLRWAGFFVTEKLNCRCLLGTGFLAAFLVPPESVKYRYKPSGISGVFIEILKGLQKNCEVPGNFSESKTFPEGLKFFQRLSGAVSEVLKVSLLGMKPARMETV